MMGFEQVSFLAAMYVSGDSNVVDRHFDELYEFFQDEMPYGTLKARDGDPYEWIAKRLVSITQGF